jgi:hypothetical protein
LLIIIVRVQQTQRPDAQHCANWATGRGASDSD